jgi:hypothetical protein
VSVAPATHPPEHAQPTTATPVANRRPLSGKRAVAYLVGAVAPALAAVWAVPWFVTQDGPAHVYNAAILVASVGGFDPSSTWRDVYTIRWQVIPNWAGPLSLAGMIACLPAWAADRIMTSVTFVGFAAAMYWLRWRVAGARGLPVTAVLASLLGLNVCWLYGFSSFLLGASFFAITLGAWWPNRDHLNPARLGALAVLLTVGYFCHLVSLGLTLVGLVVLSVLAPVPSERKPAWRAKVARLARLAAATIPVFGLGLCYLSIARQRAGMWPVWENLSSTYSPRAWVARAEWVDPLSLAIRDGLPLTDRYGAQYVAFAPVIWLAVAIILWWYGSIAFGPPMRAYNDRRGWFFLAAVLIGGSAIGPDSFGADHGEFLPQRVALLGLVALVPIFDVDLSRWAGKATLGALVAGLTLQSAVVWDYALHSDRTAGQLIRACEAVGHGQRVATLLITTKSRFRPNPLLHADNWLGVDTGNVVWNNYETGHYYFPVHFRSGIDRPLPGDLEWVSLHEEPKEAAERASGWNEILSLHAHSIDVVVVWKSDPALEAITTRWFDEVERRGDIHIFRRRSPQSLAK